MESEKKESLNLTFQPVTEKRWPDFEKLFGERGACGGCWCMLWRLTRAEFEKQKGNGNKKAMKAIIGSGEIPGILAYDGDMPVGWCSVAPREKFPALERSRIMKKVDENPVWSITCFFIHKDFRKKGLSVQLLKATIEYVQKKGGKRLEGYPIEPKKDKMPPAFAWTGIAAAFKKAGFKEVARRSETRPIMRYTIRNS